VYALKQGIPSDMWKQREASLRETAKAEIRNKTRQRPYGWGGTNECFSIVREGATVKVKEVRATPTGGGQVFYDISYSNQSQSPEIVLQNGKLRFFRSGVFSVAFEKSADNVLVAQSYCPAVGGTIVTWPVPSLIADEALRIASAAKAIPSYLPMQISRSASVGSDRNWENWKQFVDAAQLLKSTLEKHGWSVSGFKIPGVGYYSIWGEIEPPASAKKWIIGPFKYFGRSVGYEVVFLEHAESKLQNFTAQEDTAIASFSTKFSGCTAFCELWKDVRTMPNYIGSSIFFGAIGKYKPSLNLDDAYTTTVNFAWTPSNGWHVKR
jgi:hypothetical protein